MKRALSSAILIASMFTAVSGMGGMGIGGGLRVTEELLQSFPYSEVSLTFKGNTNPSEPDDTPRLVIPEQEYAEILAEVEVMATKKTASPLLKVQRKDGTVRYFVIEYKGVWSREPIFIDLKEVQLVKVKDAKECPAE